MIQEIHSFDEYEDFIRELATNPLYSDPHFTYDKDNLYRSLMAKDEHAFVVSENGITIPKNTCLHKKRSKRFLWQNPLSSLKNAEAFYPAKLWRFLSQVREACGKSAGPF